LTTSFLYAPPAFPVVLDTAANMAWEPAAEAEVKDRYERRLCRAGQGWWTLDVHPSAGRNLKDVAGRNWSDTSPE
jgi:hypothetical protein